MPTVSIKSGVGADVMDGTDWNASTWGLGRYYEDTLNYVDAELLVRFDLSAINGIVKYAELELAGFKGNYDADFYVVEAHKITESWDHTTVNWTNKPSYQSNPLDSKEFGDTSYTGGKFKRFNSASLALAVNDMVNNVNHGFIFKGVSLGEGYSTIYNFDETEVARRPTLTITYNEPPNVPGAITTPSSGTRWTGNQIVRWGAATDSDTPQSELQYEGQISYDNGVSWVSLFSLTGKGALEKQVDFTQFAESNQAKVRVRAYDGELYGNWQTSQAFIINHNLSPNAPNQLSPSGGKVIAKSESNRFTWSHNDINGDPQEKYDLYYRLQGSGTWTKVSDATLNQYHNFAPNTFTEGVWEWKVVTYDEEFASPDSSISVFEVRTKPSVPTFTNPTDSEVITTAQPTVSWSSSTQTGYSLVIEENSKTVWFINEDTTNMSKQIDYSLSDNSLYTLKLRIKNQYGLLSDAASISIATDYIEPPQPSVSVSEGVGHIVIDITNPNPTGEQPELSFNEVYKLIEGDWVRVAFNLPANGQFRDYSVKSGKTYEYKVRVIGDNFTFIDSGVASSSVKLRGVWLHDVVDPEQTVRQFKFDGGGRSSNRGIKNALIEFKGRSYPVMETEESFNYVIDFTLTLKDEADRVVLEEFFFNRNMVCYRDGRGRIAYGILTELPLTDELWGGQTTSLQLMQIDYKEGI